MPIYEYRCNVCEQQFEEIVPRAGYDEVACPHCGTQEVNRLFSSFGVGHANGNRLGNAARENSSTRQCGCSGCTCGHGG